MYIYIPLLIQYANRLLDLLGTCYNGHFFYTATHWSSWNVTDVASIVHVVVHGDIEQVVSLVAGIRFHIIRTVQGRDIKTELALAYASNVEKARQITYPQAKP